MRHRNRKSIFRGGWIDYKGEKIEIMNSYEYGVYSEILYSFINQFDLIINRHRRVLVLFLQLHVNYYSEDNKHISNLLKNIKQFLKRKYGMNDIGYQWVREQEKSKKQHYHAALILDGNLIQHPSKLLNIIKDMWLPRGHFYRLENCFYYLDKNNMNAVRKDVISRASYMAKIRGKGYRPSQTKDYSSSRLRYSNK